MASPITCTLDELTVPECDVGCEQVLEHRVVDACEKSKKGVHCAAAALYFVVMDGSAAIVTKKSDETARGSLVSLSTCDNLS